MDYLPTPDDLATFEVAARVKCTTCAREAHVVIPSNLGLRPGDMLLASDSTPAYGRCIYCLRYTLQLTDLPQVVPQHTLTGFWKRPGSTD